MTPVVLEQPNTVDVVSETIASAAASEARRTGRPCRLADPAVTRTILVSLHGRMSRTGAARAAGVSEGVLRRWLQPGAQPTAACLTLQRAVEYIEHPPPATTTPQPPAEHGLPTAPAVQQSVVRRWHWSLALAAVLEATDPLTATMLRTQVRQEMRAFGLTTLPPMDERWLPPNLDHSAIRQHYIHWCHATGQPGPREMDVEMHALPWYLQHVVKPD